MKKLDVQEYADLVGKSKTAVYNSINENKVKYIVESVNGRDVKKVLIEDKEYEDLLNYSSLNKVEKENIFNLNQVNSMELKQSQDMDKPDIVLELVNQIKESQKHFVEYHKQFNDLQNKLVNYAELAGQTRLLTDSETQTKQQYFQILAENKTLEKESIELKTKNEMYQQKIKELEEKLNQQDQSKKWWSKL